MTAVADPTRSDLIERYVLFNALEDLLANLIDVVRDPGEFTTGLDLPEEAHADNFQLTGREGGPGLSDLFERLWPDDEDLERPEHLLAEARSDALVAQLAATLSIAGERLVGLSNRFSSSSAKAIAKATTGPREEGERDG